MRKLKVPNLSRTAKEPYYFSNYTEQLEAEKGDITSPITERLQRMWHFDEKI